MKIATIALCCMITAVPAVVVAHPGGTDKNGCHTNRKTGDRHCHSRPGSSGGRQPLAGNTTSNGRAFVNCAAARAAGAAPVRRGEPGYGRHLDRDGDGVGCE